LKSSNCGLILQLVDKLGLKPKKVDFKINETFCTSQVMRCVKVPTIAIVGLLRKVAKENIERIVQRTD
jgi:hypothetical protein